MSRLINDFFFVHDLAAETNTLRAAVKINAAHIIFKGHFPGMPVVPGVCMTQMVKEILEEHTTHSLLLSKADHLKFLSVLSPDEHTGLQAEIKFTQVHHSIEATASLFNATSVFFKLKGTYLPV